MPAPLACAVGDADCVTMLDRLLASQPPLPSALLPGSLLARSGFDARSDASAGLLLRAGEKTGTLEILAPRRGRLLLALPSAAVCRLATSEVVAWSWPQGEAVFSLMNRQVLVGRCPPEMDYALRLDDAEDGCLQIQRDGERLALAAAEDREAAGAWCAAGLNADLELVLREALRSYGLLPANSPDASPSLAQAWSSLRIYIHSPQLGIDRRWLSAGRDCPRVEANACVQAALALRRLDPYCSWEVLQSLFTDEAVRPASWCPGEPDGEDSPLAPPILAWAVLQVYKLSPDSGALTAVLPPLQAHLQLWQQQTAVSLTDRARLARDLEALQVLLHVADRQAERQVVQAAAEAQLRQLEAELSPETAWLRLLIPAGEAAADNLPSPASLGQAGLMVELYEALQARDLSQESSRWREDCLAALAANQPSSAAAERAASRLRLLMARVQA